MRSFIIITVLSAFAACYGVSDLMNEEVQERYTMLYDENTPNGRIVSDTELKKITEEIPILAQWYCQAPALPEKKQRVGVMYEGPPGTTMVVYLVFYHPPEPKIEHSKWGSNFLSINITSPIGISVDAVVALYGKIPK